LQIFFELQKKTNAEDGSKSIAALWTTEGRSDTDDKIDSIGDKVEHAVNFVASLYAAL